MPVIGPDNKTMYLPHEAYDLWGRAEYGKSWESIFVLPNDVWAGFGYDKSKGQSIIVDQDAYNNHIDNLRLTSNTLFHLASRIFKCGFVPVWIYPEGFGLWRVAVADEWELEKCSEAEELEYWSENKIKKRMSESGEVWKNEYWDEEQPDGWNVPSLFIAEILRGREEPESLKKNILVEKLPFDRFIKEDWMLHKADWREFNKGAGGNPNFHEPKKIVQLVRDLYLSDEPPESMSKAADQIINRLSDSGVAPPSKAYVRSLIKFSSDLDML
jgi:hypothetical protein